MFSFHALDCPTLDGHMPKDKFQHKMMVTFTFALTSIKVRGQYSSLEICLGNRNRRLCDRKIVEATIFSLFSLSFFFFLRER